MTFWRVMRTQETCFTCLTGHLTLGVTNQIALTLKIDHVTSYLRPSCVYKNGHLQEKCDLSEFRRSFFVGEESHGSISELERGKPSPRKNSRVHLCSQRRRVCDREASVFLERWRYKLMHKMTDPSSEKMVRASTTWGCKCYRCHK